MTVTLRDLIAESKDGEWGKGEPTDCSVEMHCIRGTDFAAVRYGKLDDVPIRYIARQHAARKRLEPWDLLIEAAGGTKEQPTGRTVLLKPSLFQQAELPFICASFSRFVRLDHEKCDPGYVFWMLQHLYTSGYLVRYHTQHTGVARFQWTVFADTHKLVLPPLDEQRRIAGILSAYDDLIENCQRRIKILEEMARSLYREWFVHFRYPGHESVPLVDSPLGPIPKGWDVKKLGDVAALTMGQSPKSEFYNSVGDGLPFHQGVTDFGNRFPTDRLFCTAAGRLAEPGDILFSVRAPVGRLNIAPKRLILGRGLSAIRHRLNLQALLWEQLRAKFTTLDMIGSGSIFASVTRADMEGIELVSPPDYLAQKADELLRPNHELVGLLSAMEGNLRLTRDLLLPDLLGGARA